MLRRQRAQNFLPSFSSFSQRTCSPEAVHTAVAVFNTSVEPRVGAARHGTARHGTARHGTARVAQTKGAQREAWRGRESEGKARLQFQVQVSYLDL